MIVAFDCDGTLIDLRGRVLWETVAMLRTLSKMGNRIIVWSGGGKAYAEHIVRELKIEPYVAYCLHKNQENGREHAVDLCFDDEFVEIARISAKV